MGALGHLWRRLRAPVHARDFTANIARLKLEEAGGDPDAVTEAAPWPEMVQAGPFRVGFVPVSHSIPESSALVIDTPAGRVVHTGDFKLDTAPIVGEPFDRALWGEVADDGVQALVCDSTNVFVDHAGPVGEHAARRDRTAGGRGAGHGGGHDLRLERRAAEDAGRGRARAGRSVCLLGRAMRRMIEAAVRTGVLTDFPHTITPEEARDVPRGDLMLIVTGSQGERRAASAQLSRGKYLGLELAEGDLFLFSSKTIPGNERGVIRIMNAFSEMGVDVVDDSAGHTTSRATPTGPTWRRCTS